jgi:hypothetical protein
LKNILNPLCCTPTVVHVHPLGYRSCIPSKGRFRLFLDFRVESSSLATCCFTYRFVSASSRVISAFSRRSFSLRAADSSCSRTSVLRFQRKKYRCAAVEACSVAPPPPEKPRPRECGRCSLVDTLPAEGLRGLPRGLWDDVHHGRGVTDGAPQTGVFLPFPLIIHGTVYVTVNMQALGLDCHAGRIGSRASLVWTLRGPGVLG